MTVEQAIIRKFFFWWAGLVAVGGLVVLFWAAKPLFSPGTSKGYGSGGYLTVERDADSRYFVSENRSTLGPNGAFFTPSHSIQNPLAFISFRVRCETREVEGQVVWDRVELTVEGHSGPNVPDADTLIYPQVGPPETSWEKLDDATRNDVRRSVLDYYAVAQTSKLKPEWVETIQGMDSWVGARWHSGRIFPAIAAAVWGPGLAVFVAMSGLAVLVFLIAFTVMTRRARISGGFCVGCGYPRHVGTERCPECGKPYH